MICYSIDIFLKNPFQCQKKKRKMAATELGKSKVFHPHSSHPGFMVIFFQTLLHKQFEKDQRKTRETLEVHKGTMML